MQTMPFAISQRSQALFLWVLFLLPGMFVIPGVSQVWHYWQLALDHSFLWRALFSLYSNYHSHFHSDIDNIFPLYFCTHFQTYFSCIFSLHITWNLYNYNVSIVCKEWATYTSFLRDKNTRHEADMEGLRLEIPQWSSSVHFCFHTWESRKMRKWPSKKEWNVIFTSLSVDWGQSQRDFLDYAHPT